MLVGCKIMGDSIARKRRERGREVCCAAAPCVCAVGAICTEVRLCRPTDCGCVVCGSTNSYRAGEVRCPWGLLSQQQQRGCPEADPHLCVSLSLWG